jgi:uncharacterized membrane protein YfcA
MPVLSPAQLALLLGIGLFIGVLSSMLGIGGGVLVIPILTGIFLFSQKQAVGTSLAMLLPPIGLFAVLAAYRAGNVSIPAAGMLAGGFLIGGLLGGMIANAPWMPDQILRRVFAVFLLYVGFTILVRNDPKAGAALGTLWALLITAVAYAGLRLIGRRLDAAAHAPAAEIYREKLARKAAARKQGRDGSVPPPDYVI